MKWKEELDLVQKCKNAIFAWKYILFKTLFSLSFVQYANGNGKIDIQQKDLETDSFFGNQCIQ